MTAVLKFIGDLLTTNSINYEFFEWTSDIVYPYFVGEYSEVDFDSESGYKECDFTLNGFSRDSWKTLEDARETIERIFSDCTTVLENDSGINISYNGSLIIPTGDDELKRIQIRLKIKEWKVTV